MCDEGCLSTDSRSGAHYNSLAHACTGDPMGALAYMQLGIHCMYLLYSNMHTGLSGAFRAVTD